jgi:hypothetical protein
VINPLLIANFSKLSLRKTKTDKKDAMTIAQFLLVHVPFCPACENRKTKGNTEGIAEERGGYQTDLYSRRPDKDCEAFNCNDKSGEGTHRAGQDQDTSASTAEAR